MTRALGRTLGPTYYVAPCGGHGNPKNYEILGGTEHTGGCVSREVLATFYGPTAKERAEACANFLTEHGR